MTPPHPHPTFDGSRNSSAQSHYLLQAHYGRRDGAWSRRNSRPISNGVSITAVIAACTPRQRRLLDDHPPAEYD